MGKRQSDVEEIMEAFNQKHGALVQQIVEAINGMVLVHDGDSLLLFRKHLEIILENIDAGLGVQAARIKAGDN